MRDSYLKKRTKKNGWLKKLKGLKLAPLMEVIETCSAEDIDDAEKFWISQFRALGFNLLNATEGGEGVSGRVPGLVQRTAASRTHRGRPKSDDEVIKISRSNGGRPFVDQHGNIYLTQGEAARKLGLDQANVCAVLHGRLKRTGGRSFTYLS